MEYGGAGLVEVNSHSGATPRGDDDDGDDEAASAPAKAPKARRGTVKCRMFSFVG